ncbi:MAG: MaoC family dehydratase [Chloroflexota bacterium]
MNDDAFQQLHGYYIEELTVGQTAVYSKMFTDADVLQFTAVSGDDNPLHTNAEFAEKTRFGKHIIHGMLTTSLWSTIIGTKLPGPGCAYMSQSLNFYLPVYVGDTVMAVMTITKIDIEKQRVFLEGEAYVSDKLVASGEAMVWVPKKNGKAPLI